MTRLTRTKKNENITFLKSNDEKYAWAKNGVNDGSTKYPSPINPIFCAKYVILTVIIGVNKNGIANIALNTIGPPKIIGSLIPHIPGIIESLHN